MFCSQQGWREGVGAGGSRGYQGPQYPGLGPLPFVWCQPWNNTRDRSSCQSGQGVRMTFGTVTPDCWCALG